MERLSPRSSIPRYRRENDCIAHFIEAVPQQVVQDLEDMVRKGCGPGIILYYHLLL